MRDSSKSNNKKSEYIPSKMEIIEFDYEEVVLASELTTSLGDATLSGVTGASWNSIYSDE